jgi:hypothetical protein
MYQYILKPPPPEKITFSQKEKQKQKRQREQQHAGLRSISVTTHCDFEAEAAATAAQRDQRRLEPLERAACLQRRQPLLARQVARRRERSELRLGRIVIFAPEGAAR